MQARGVRERAKLVTVKHVAITRRRRHSAVELALKQRIRQVTVEIGLRLTVLTQAEAHPGAKAAGMSTASDGQCNKIAMLFMKVLRDREFS